ncbi:hypothetical protein RRG08_038900 [Elysia crispata]|uniref:Secreted protein n=1 Tax=Elysia crispata TaxID=231223 RepID=A0AAE1CTF4_9GAST|nr:hypothetical protein RRG08_038900 [Elysia crispata]
MAVKSCKCILACGIGLVNALPTRQSLSGVVRVTQNDGDSSGQGTAAERLTTTVDDDDDDDDKDGGGDDCGRAAAKKLAGLSNLGHRTNVARKGFSGCRYGREEKCCRRWRFRIKRRKEIEF